MSIIGVLRKLGILRFGAKKYQYRSGREMPAEALFDDVYDAEKDLITAQDFRHQSKVKREHPEPEFHEDDCRHCGEMLQADDKFCRHCGSKRAKG